MRIDPRALPTQRFGAADLAANGCQMSCDITDVRTSSSGSESAMPAPRRNLRRERAVRVET
jgi:hypothetical protein